MAIDSGYWELTMSHTDNFSICTACLVCGEAVPVVSPSDGVKICDKCKAAIMAMRVKMDGDAE